MLRPLKGNAGFSIVSALFLIGMVSLATGGIAAYYTNVHSAMRHIGISDTVLQVKYDVMSVLDNDANWATMVNSNANLACLRKTAIGTTCPAGDLGAISLLNLDGTPYLSAGAGNEGFDLMGNRCTTWNISEDCAFRYEVRVACNGPCTPTQYQNAATDLVASSPRLKLTGEFMVSPRIAEKLGNLSGTKYDIQMIRGSMSQTMSNSCNTLAGIFDQRTNVCKSNIGTADAALCLAGEWFVGYNADGSKICVPDIKRGKYCPDGAAATGMDSRGNLSCSSF